MLFWYHDLYHGANIRDAGAWMVLHGGTKEPHFQLSLCVKWSDASGHPVWWWESCPPHSGPTGTLNIAQAHNHQHRWIIIWLHQASLDPTLIEKTYWSWVGVSHTVRMYWPAVAALSLALSGWKINKHLVTVDNYALDKSEINYQIRKKILWYIIALDMTFVFKNLSFSTFQKFTTLE